MNSLEMSPLDHGRRIVELYGHRIAKAKSIPACAEDSEGYSVRWLTLSEIVKDYWRGNGYDPMERNPIAQGYIPSNRLFDLTKHIRDI
jgi:hypothetical protein